jgi:hypothetical protein
VLTDDELDGQDPLPDLEYSKSPKGSKEGVGDRFDLLCFPLPAMVLGGWGFLKKRETEVSRVHRQNERICIFMDKGGHRFKYCLYSEQSGAVKAHVRVPRDSIFLANTTSEIKYTNHNSNQIKRYRLDKTTHPLGGCTTSCSLKNRQVLHAKLVEVSFCKSFHIRQISVRQL